MKLRPHHLMCTQGYTGKGYDENFVAKMDEITNKLRGNNNIDIDLVFSTDDICVDCPNMIESDVCVTNEKVKYIDDKMIQYFKLEEKEYNYNQIVNIIKDNITSDIMDDICNRCEWYKISNCKNKMLEKNI